MKLHLHKFKIYERKGYTEREFLGETFKEFRAFQTFRICKKCGKAQEYFADWDDLATWHDLSEGQKKILLEKINTGEVILKEK